MHIREIKSKSKKGIGLHESIVIENNTETYLPYSKLTANKVCALITGNDRTEFDNNIEYVIKITKIEEEINNPVGYELVKHKLISGKEPNDKRIVTYYKKHGSENYTSGMIDKFLEQLKYKLRTRHKYDAIKFIRDYRKGIRKKYGKHKIIDILGMYSYLNEETGDLEYHKKLNYKSTKPQKYGRTIDVKLNNGRIITLENTLVSKENLEKDIAEGKVKYDALRDKLYRIYKLSEINNSNLTTEYVKYEKGYNYRTILMEEIYHEIPKNVNCIIDEYSNSTTLIRNTYNDIDSITVVGEDTIVLPYGEIPTKRGIERYEYKDYMLNSSILVKDIDDEKLNFKYYKVIGSVNNEK